MSTHDRLTYLLEQALQRSATEAELRELSALVSGDASGDIARQLEMLIQNELPANPTADYDTAHWDAVVDNILAADKVVETRKPLRIWRWIPAAAAVLLLAIGLYYMRQPSHKPPAVAARPEVQDLAPGGNKAVLTLADGTELTLDSSGHKALAKQGNTSITQPAGGQLAYTTQPGQPSATGLTQYNILRTPRGGQFQVTLPDGTRVWLNAASSLKYPVAFNGTSRQVELTGEAYFEVASNAAMPFKVMVPAGQDNRMEVAVLGTQFNIMSYADEAEIKTTLLEGAVNVTNKGNSKKLMPGQGALLDKQRDQLSVLQQVNTEEAVAWKNGFIQLEGNDIATVMRMIARWYDVDVVLTEPVPVHFRGSIPRNVPVSQALKLLEMTGEVHFELRDRKITVTR
ncbi:ferric-dicitrate binding protein FerR (iron transport regulator) [Chitinophaga terrae (ex Kim and Jung 2007)]|uniref:FecR family protein n=1 Tax=Chitinophaga terrae (ex Kim and Jung 2007) TaxID=408074 RepID=UPI00278306E0|nr:FecR family protein [Chitinophaga terrae (ex Kim and Jung 2007)]MDQ0107430.1 ferric-dicitrate binding protein FerR (iron transport regulator) [Chitinophaga terrae (ex Kim and Jung 2007)]